MLAIGVYAARRAQTSDDFVVAGRSLPLWLCTATLTATWMGSGTVMGAAGAAYERGLLGVIADPFGAALCLLLTGFFFARTLRRMRLLTVTDLFEIRYGQAAGMFCSLSLVFAFIGWAGSQLVAFGFVLHTLLGVETTTGILVGAVVVLAYTTAGGMWAVALTDFAQLIVLLVGLIVIAGGVFWGSGGWGAIVGQLPPHTFRMIPLESTGSAWMEYFRAWMIIGIGSLAAQDVLQRALSAGDERVAQNSFYLSAFGYLTLGMIPVSLGIAGSVLLPGLENPEFVVPQLALEYLHPVLVAVFAGALLAAIMSSADSALLAPASLLSSNVVPYFRPNVSSRAKLAWARYSIPVFGVAALVVALFVQRVYALMLDAFSVTLVALVVPFAAAVWWPRANRLAALAAMGSGTLTWIGLLASASDYPADLIGFLAGAVVLVLVTLLTQKQDPPRPLTDRDGNALDLQGRLGNRLTE